jgi:hypothetical protein
VSEKEKPLPKPPKTPLGKKRFKEGEEDVPLMADRMAVAMAEGKLEEFMKQEMPDNDYARTLASMMMGMTGMTPSGVLPPLSGKAPQGSDKTEEADPPEGISSGVQTPEDVINAVQSGDVKNVMEILAREHKKRSPGSASILAEERKTDDIPGLSDVEKETLNQLIKIASENNVSIDWTVLRALKLYIREYRKTGRL